MKPYNETEGLAFYDELPNSSLSFGFSFKYNKIFNLTSINISHKKHNQKIIINRDTGLQPISLTEMEAYLTEFIAKYKLEPSNNVVLYVYLNPKNYSDLLFIRNFNVFISKNGSLEFYKDNYKNISPFTIEIFDLSIWVNNALKYDTAKLNYLIGDKIRKEIKHKFDIDILTHKTPAKTGIIAFRHNYIEQNNPILAPEHTIRRQAILKNRGGLSLAFKRGIFKSTFMLYDANSMYPSCAIEIAELPTKDNWIQIDNLEDLIKTKGGFASVKFKFPDNEIYPCLPISEFSFSKNHNPMKKMFYTLEGYSYCTSYEIALALSKDADITIMKDKNGEPYCYGYYKGDNRFPTFLRELRFQKSMYSEIKNTYKDVSVIANAFSKVYKNLANYSIGKLFSEYSKYTNDYYPEWDTLILGKSREINFRAFELTDSYIGTTDSTITELDLGNNFFIDNIQYELKGIGNELGILRNKAYYLKKDNEIIHSALLGISLSKDNEYKKPSFIQKGLLEPFITNSNPEILTPEQVLRAKLEKYETKQKISSRWDFNRVLLKNGNTIPLKDQRDLVRQLRDKAHYDKKIKRIEKREFDNKPLTKSQIAFKEKEKI